VKSLTTICFILLIPFSSNGQKTNGNLDSLNLIDTAGLRQGEWTLYCGHWGYPPIICWGIYEDEKRKGLWTCINGKHLWYEATYEEGILNGVYILYHKEKIKSIFIFKDGKLNGVARFFNRKGKIVALYEFNNDAIARIIYRDNCKCSPPNDLNYKPMIPYPCDY